ncbi:hypothetical protein TGARI_227940 [Toxoplasma gondii ARI]|uniref:Transmembrane protein n=1 Tax=Toxoplasma gondii ARI TaxID=1074872 RepID=A0A139XXJ5_TOXGO|nr:hypothetical protein TGARI_227940 [Toxoplasma gondii ARI]
MRLSVSSRVDAHQFPRSRLASLYFLCLYASVGSYRVLLLCLSSTIPFLRVSRCSLFLSVSHPFAPAAPFSHRFFFSVFLYRSPLLGVRTVTLSLHYRRRFSSSESVSAWVPLSRSRSWCFERVCGEKVFRISFCLLMEIKRVIKRSSKMSKHHISSLFHSQENGFSRDVSTALHLFIGHFFPSLLLTFSFLLAAVFTDISFPSAHSGGH